MRKRLKRALTLVLTAAILTQSVSLDVFAEEKMSESNEDIAVVEANTADEENTGDLNEIAPGLDGTYSVTTEDGEITEINIDYDDLNKGLDYDEETAQRMNADGGTYIGTIPNMNVPITRYDMTEASESDTEEYNTVEYEEEMNQRMDDIVNGSVIQGDELKSVLAAADAFAGTVQKDGTGEWMKVREVVTNLQGKAVKKQSSSVEPVSLIYEENDTSLVEILDTSKTNDTSEESVGNAASVVPLSQEVFVVDDDAVLIYVTDEEDKPIGGATVTISYLDDKNERQTKVHVTEAIDSPKAGFAVFSEMKGIETGVVDVQAAGFHTNTSLDAFLDGGSKISRKLTQWKEDEEYGLRCADVAGSDLINNTNEFNLRAGTKTMDMTILLEKNPSKSTVNFPEVLKLKADQLSESGNVAETRELRTDFIRSEYIKDNPSTMQYVYKTNWIEEPSSYFHMLEPGDHLYVSDMFKSGEEPDYLNVTVKMAPVKKSGWIDWELSLVNGGLHIKLPKDIPFVGDSSLNMDLFEFPVTAGYLPGGKFILGVGDVLNNDPFYEQKEALLQIQTPHDEEKAEIAMNKVQKKYENKIALMRQDHSFIQSKAATPKRLFSNSSEGFDFTPSFNVILDYNDQSECFEGNLNIGVKGEVHASSTEYYTIPTPISIPVYVGGGINGALQIAGGAGMSLKSNWSWETIGDDIGLSASADNGLAATLMIGLMAYAGVGIHNLVGVEAEGAGSVDMTADWKHLNIEKPAGSTLPRKLLDANASLTAYINFLFGRITYPIISKKWPLSDSWHLYDDKSLEASEAQISGPVIQNVDMDAVSETDSLTAGMQSYELKNKIIAPLAVYERLTPVARKVLADNQVQYVTAVGRSQSEPTSVGQTALFRIASVNGRPRLVYQMCEPQTGRLYGKAYPIDAPSGQKDVMEFSVLGNQDPDDHPYAYICMITGDYSEADLKKRALTTQINMVIVDLSTQKIIGNRVASASDDKTYKFGCVVAEGNRHMSAAWRVSPVLCSADTLTRVDAANYNTANNYSFRQNVVGACNSLISIGNMYREDDFSFLAGRTDEKGTTYQPFDRDLRVKDLQPFYISASEKDGTSVISNIRALGNRCYAICQGELKEISVYRENNKKYISFNAVQDAKGNTLSLPSVMDCCVFTLDQTDGNLYLINAIPNAVRETDGSYQAKSTTVNYYAIRHDNESSVIYGPYSETVPVKVTNFSATWQNNTKHISLLISESNEEVTDPKTDELICSCNLYLWNEKSLSRNVALTDFNLDSVIKRTLTTIPAQIEVKNTGFTPIDTFWLKVTDGKGTELKLTDASGKELSGDAQYNAAKGYSFTKKLMPFTSEVLTIYMQPNKGWETGAVSLNAAVTDPVAQADSDVRVGADSVSEDSYPSSDYSITIEDEHLTIQGKQILIGDDHVASMVITNESLVPVHADDLNLILLNDTENGEVIKETIPLEQLLGDSNFSDAHRVTSLDGTLREHSYNVDLNLENLWKDNQNGEGILRSVTFALVPKDFAYGDKENQVSFEDTPHIPKVRFSNPYAPLCTPVVTDVNDVDGGTTDGDGGYLPGETATLTAEPYQGYVFTGWTDTDGNVVSTSAQYGITVGNEKKIYYANFVEDGSIHKLKFVLSGPSVSGKVCGSIGVSGNGVFHTRKNSEEAYLVPHGESVTLTAYPETGYECVGWYDENGDLISSLKEDTFTANSSQTLTVKFDEKVQEEFDPNTLYLHELDMIDLTVPDTLSENSSLNTVEKISAKLKDELNNQLPNSIKANKLCMFDVVNMRTASLVGNITYYVPYPEGTADGFAFGVVGMRKSDGGIEIPDTENTEDGIKVTFSGPVEMGIGWEAMAYNELIDKETAQKRVGGLSENGYVEVKLSKESYPYTGSEIRPNIKKAAYIYMPINSNGRRSTKSKTVKLVENRDYSLSYSNNITTGQAEMIVKGLGDYTGTFTVPFGITQRDIKNVTIDPIADIRSLGTVDMTNVILSEITVRDGALVLDSSDYTASFEVDGTKTDRVIGSSDKDQSVKVIIQGTESGNYKGTAKKTVTFQLLSTSNTAASIEDLTNLTLKKPNTKYIYSGKQIRPAVRVKTKEGRTLSSKYYKVTYRNNINAGTGTVRIVGKKGYYGSKEITFPIAPKELKKITVKSLSKLAFMKTADQIKPVLKNGSTYLTEGKDYEIDYSTLNEKEISLGLLKLRKIELKATAVTEYAGKPGNYTGEKIIKCTIVPCSLNNPMSIKVSCPDMKFVSKDHPLEPKPVIFSRGERLVEGTDYTIKSYSNNKKVGTGKVTVVGKGNYSGKRTIKFDITKE